MSLILDHSGHADMIRRSRLERGGIGPYMRGFLKMEFQFQSQFRSPHKRIKTLQSQFRRSGSDSQDSELSEKVRLY